MIELTYRDRIFVYYHYFDDVLIVFLMKFYYTMIRKFKYSNYRINRSLPIMSTMFPGFVIIFLFIGLSVAVRWRRSWSTGWTDFDRLGFYKWRKEMISVHKQKQTSWFYKYRFSIEFKFSETKHIRWSKRIRFPPKRMLRCWDIKISGQLHYCALSARRGHFFESLTYRWIIMLGINKLVYQQNVRLKYRTIGRKFSKTTE
jgi:hypothetical protein